MELAIENISYEEEDRANIYLEQQAVFEKIFQLLDSSKIAFVGGVADYINLRSYYEMPVHDLDIIYQDEKDLTPVIEKYNLRRHGINFYNINESREVLVSEIFINKKRVHIDFFKRNFSKMRLQESYLLGTKVLHTSFDEMMKFHNDHIPLLTSDTMGANYEWRRLYKHSKKASLYNNVRYLKEKGLLKQLTK
ncbi:hypothetical protein J8L88_20760 [Aquimarina sp. MMG015]|uniref:hypothetical protein n=1 Tax=unclassified Aquimarina TaxID=2627091 RepID=UPI000E484A4A|nr:MULTISPECIES: hypothetical protein [unclassified Aquimarina]AXT58663.1 hypothetical protein D1815_08915 [Aquimarina sp. AD1]MBQ4805305.1 hypothetical protein [Aquimarina sp. MMG015]RKN29345.1 hypothetical protein D7035_07040 [Aquimarina sp. AD1]